MLLTKNGKKANKNLAEFEGLSVIPNNYMRTSVFCLPKIRERELSYHENWGELIRVFSLFCKKCNFGNLTTSEHKIDYNQIVTSFNFNVLNNDLGRAFSNMNSAVIWFNEKFSLLNNDTDVSN